MVKRERKGNFKGIFLISLSRRSEIFFVGGREGLLVIPRCPLRGFGSTV